MVNRVIEHRPSTVGTGAEGSHTCPAYESSDGRIRRCRHNGEWQQAYVEGSPGHCVVEPAFAPATTLGQ